jgi:hypothetical protein
MPKFPTRCHIFLEVNANFASFVAALADGQPLSEFFIRGEDLIPREVFILMSNIPTISGNVDLNLCFYNYF